MIVSKARKPVYRPSHQADGSDRGIEPMTMNSKQSRMLSFATLFALTMAFFGVGLFAGAPRTDAAAPDCGGQELAGHWVNPARHEGTDLGSVDLRIPCSGALAAAGRAPAPLIPKIELQVSMRCLHIFSCDWKAVPAIWSAPERRNGNPVLAAHVEQDRFDRTVTLEPVEGGKLRVTITSRLKGLAVAPVKTSYTLQRTRV